MIPNGTHFLTSMYNPPKFRNCTILDSRASKMLKALNTMITGRLTSHMIDVNKTKRAC